MIWGSTVKTQTSALLKSGGSFWQRMEPKQSKNQLKVLECPSRTLESYLWRLQRDIKKAEYVYPVMCWRIWSYQILVFKLVRLVQYHSFCFISHISMYFCTFQYNAACSSRFIAKYKEMRGGFIVWTVLYCLCKKPGEKETRQGTLKLFYHCVDVNRNEANMSGSCRKCMRTVRQPWGVQ